MPEIDPELMTHKLAVHPASRPVQQRRQKLGLERAQVVEEQVQALLEARFIREVKYPAWLENVILVKKQNGNWRMCVDYTDLNKACPKDPYPLPNIDTLVDSSSGYQYLSFIDAYSGYNQIPINKSGQEKTSFITPRANYCYMVMPFGLKNAGATYQRSMNKVFTPHLGSLMEVYVDDMVVKTKDGVSLLTDLSQVFDTIRKHGMRLIPTKCTFAVEVGKFLGFILTQRGIEANLDKYRAIVEMNKLSKFDLKYETRTAIKAQCLTDFVAEYTGDQIETSTTWELYVGGSSNKVGSGAGIILVNEEGTQIEVSLKFDFSTSNNQAEYEALIAGLKLAKEIGATKETEVKHKARKLNSRADALSKLASTKPRRNNRSLIQEILQDPSVIKMNSKSDVLLVSGLNLGWMIPIVEYLKFDILPEEQKEAYKCRKEAQNYTLVRNVLYKRGISIALLKCVPTSKTEDVLDEVHNGICGNHLRARSLARKVIRAGFFWPTLQKNATNSVKKCQHCQMHANFHVAPPEELISVTSPRPFAKWGLYLLRPFFQAPG
ncbi:uncharacterized protein LOC107633004 [Arachis ipaensis]|uniref:uncharacterized protein LOC107633004 n=1 Tax=Arachis ipaensis TaxID=130454 RepID=UPI0007AF8969|nr:uncharacterized protein LOC107633004 [Arachis ipaensis]